MTHHKKFKNESQDARRHDQQHAAHPDEKSVQKPKPGSHSKDNKKK